MGKRGKADAAAVAADGWGVGAATPQGCSSPAAGRSRVLGGIQRASAALRWPGAAIAGAPSAASCGSVAAEAAAAARGAVGGLRQGCGVGCSAGGGGRTGGARGQGVPWEGPAGAGAALGSFGWMAAGGDREEPASSGLVPSAAATAAAVAGDGAAAGDAPAAADAAACSADEDEGAAAEKGLLLAKGWGEASWGGRLQSSPQRAAHA